MTMDSLLAGVPDTIDLLKCDVEGAERELFESCSSWLPHIRLASVECHHPYTQEDLLSALRANGVDVDVLSSESTPEFGCDSIVFRIVHEPAVRRSRALTGGRGRPCLTGRWTVEDSTPTPPECEAGSAGCSVAAGAGPQPPCRGNVAPDARQRRDRRGSWLARQGASPL